MTEENANNDDIDVDKIAVELKNLSHDKLLTRALYYEVLAMVLLKKIIPEERDKAQRLLEKTIQRTIFESMFEGIKFQRTIQGQNAANTRHQEHRAIKNDAISYYQANRENFLNKDAAAFYISEHIVPGTAFGTIRKYLRNV